MITDRVGTEIGLVTGRIKRKFRNGKDNVSNMQTAVTEKTRRAVRKTDYYVHDNAWMMMGIAAGVAFAAGFLLSRRNEEEIVVDVEAMDPDELEELKNRKKVNSWEFVHSVLPLALFAWKALQPARPLSFKSVS
jgi:ElaB/YqjD/DUF883 family membrane-anchored ribosome-binding protein